MFSVNLPNDFGKPIEWPWPTPAGAEDMYKAGYAAGVEVAAKLCEEYETETYELNWRDIEVGAHRMASVIRKAAQSPAPAAGSGEGER